MGEILEFKVFTTLATIRLKSMIKAYVMIVLQTAVYIACLLLGWFLFCMATVISKIYYRYKIVPVEVGPNYPNSGRWWVRLFISLDNLTYIYWCWTCFFWVIFNTIVALDILQPCSYLWFGQADEDWEKFKKSKKDDKAFKKGGLLYKMKIPVWWRFTGYNMILNDTVTGMFKWIGPAQQIGLPILMVFYPDLGLTNAFLLLMSH